MRLIDADSCMESICNLLAAGYTPEQVIDAQPTAFDLEKVVNRLEEELSYMKEQLRHIEGEHMAVRLRFRMRGIKDAIEEIRTGGVDVL